MHKSNEFFEDCQQFFHDLVNEKGNITCRDPIIRFSELEVVALGMALEAEEIDSGKVTAKTALQYVNYINGETIGRIKYELN